MKRASALLVAAGVAVAGCGGGTAARPPAHTAAPRATAPVTIVKRAESPLAMVCLRQARLANVRQATPTMWRGMTRNGFFVVVRRRASEQGARATRAQVPQVRSGVAGRYVVTGGVRVADRGLDVRTVLACLRR